MKIQDFIREKSNLWIFGYGSLVWKPGFDYRRSKVGHIEGYKRRFWHGDVLFRGDKEKPARVATLVEDQEACTWGVAYEVTDSQVEGSLQHLHMREVISGGYMVETVQFFPKEKGQSPLLALVYIAMPNNPTYLGPASDKEIAARIAVCRGTSGYNNEYLVRLAEFMRLHCPEVEDEHLFSIEAALLDIIRDSEGITSHDQNQSVLEAS